jgi:hypothetical protein
MLRSAIERQFEIIGEALAQLAKSDPATANRAPKSRQIISFRNVLIHRYAVVDRPTVWDVLQDDLPAPRAQVSAMLDEDEGLPQGAHRTQALRYGLEGPRMGSKSLFQKPRWCRVRGLLSWRHLYEW